MKLLVRFYGSKVLWILFVVVAVVTMTSLLALAGNFAGKKIGLIFGHVGNEFFEAAIIASLFVSVINALSDGHARRWFRLRLGKEYQVYLVSSGGSSTSIAVGNQYDYHWFKFPIRLSNSTRPGSVIVLLRKESDLTFDQQRRKTIPVSLEDVYENKVHMYDPALPAS